MSDCEDQNIFSTMCRLCLSQNVELINLYPNDEPNKNSSTSKILEIIERFTTVKIHPWDNLPQKICESCIQTILHRFVYIYFGMTALTSFQNKCKQNDEELHKMIENLNESKILNERNNDTKEILEVNVDNSEFSLESKSETANHQNIVQDTNESPAAIPSSNQSTFAGHTNQLPKSRPTNQPKIACHICGKLYNKYNLQFHINKHNGLRPYKCDVDNCTSTFTAPYELTQHKIVCHFRKPRLSCDVCGRAFKRNCALKIHRSYHFAPEIPCQICPSLFKNKKALTKHMLVHSQERNFKCATCRKSFQTRYTLRIHNRVHTNEKPYACHCGVSFAYKCLLKAHNEKYHKEAKSLPSTS